VVSFFPAPALIRRHMMVEDNRMHHALRLLEERVADRLKQDAPEGGAVLRKIFADLHMAADVATVDLPQQELIGSPLAVPVKLLSPPELADGKGEDATGPVLMPPPGLEGFAEKVYTSEDTDGLDSSMPKKVPIQGLPLPFDSLRAFQYNVASDASAPITPAMAGQKQKLPIDPQKKFCVFCGMQVDPEYLTAKFCAFCGAEHAVVPNCAETGGATGLLDTSDAASFPVSTDLKGTGDIDYYNQLDLCAWQGAEYYNGVAALAWQGAALAWGSQEAQEHGLEYPMYGHPYAYSDPSWPGPTQGMAF